MRDCKKYMALIPVIGIMIAGGACSRKNEAKERVQAEREAWEASLPDSLKATQAQMDSVRAEIEVLNNRFDAMVHTFAYVENPREVEGYYIAGAWKANYPLKTTGLIARLSKSEKLELIAALSGGSHFDRIAVETDGASAETSVVPYDQALNYRMSGLNIVCFSDSAANSCAKLIAENNGKAIKIVFKEGGKTTGTLSYSAVNQNLMQATWDLYDNRSTVTRDERMLPMLARKADILNAKIEEIKVKG